MLEEERFRQEEEQRQEIENSRKAVASQVARDPWEVHREHHKRGVERANQLLADYEAARQSSREIDFDMARKLQELLGFQDFKEVYKLGESFGECAEAFVTAVENVTIGEESTEYKDKRYRHFVIYLAASRGEALSRLEETFSPLISEDERRWIEMLRIAGVEVVEKSLTLTPDPEKEETFEVQYKVGFKVKSCSISGVSSEVAEQWIQGKSPARVFVPSLKDDTIPKETQESDRKAFRQSLRDSLVKKLATIGLEVRLRPIHKKKRVVGYEVALPDGIEIGAGSPRG